MSKFFNKKVEVDGIVFDSIKESKYYLVLKRMQETGDISNLQLQVPYPVIIEGKKICKYVADFSYNDAQGDLHVIDVKSTYTAKDKVFRLKKKLVEALYKIEIEVWL